MQPTKTGIEVSPTAVTLTSSKNHFFLKQFSQHLMRNSLHLLRHHYIYKFLKAFVKQILRRPQDL